MIHSSWSLVSNPSTPTPLQSWIYSDMCAMCSFESDRTKSRAKERAVPRGARAGRARHGARKWAIGHRNRTPQLPPFFVLPPFLFLVLSRFSKILRKGGSWKILDQRRKLGSAVPIQKFTMAARFEFPNATLGRRGYRSAQRGAPATRRRLSVTRRRGDTGARSANLSRESNNLCCA